MHVFGAPLTEIGSACVRLQVMNRESRCQKNLKANDSYIDLPVHKVGDPVKIFFSWSAGYEHNGHHYGIANWTIQKDAVESEGINLADTFIMRVFYAPISNKAEKLSFTFRAALNGSDHLPLPGENLW